MKVDSLDNSAKAKTSLMKVKVKGIRIVHYITVYMAATSFVLVKTAYNEQPTISSICVYIEKF